VEAPALHFAIEDELEGAVLNTGSGTVDLIEEEDARLGASIVEPIGRSKSGHASRTNLLVVRHTNEVAFREEAETNVKELAIELLRASRRNSALADAVRTAQENCILDIGKNDLEGAEIDRGRSRHVVSPFLLTWLLFGCCLVVVWLFVCRMFLFYQEVQPVAQVLVVASLSKK
jgi:hypothetical protein